MASGGEGRHSCNGLPVEIHSLLSELPVAMVRVLKGLILHDLYPFSPVTLLMAVFADHIQLSDFVLQSKQRNGDREVSPGLLLTNPPTLSSNDRAQSNKSHRCLLLRKVISHWGLR